MMTIRVDVMFMLLNQMEPEMRKDEEGAREARLSQCHSADVRLKPRVIPMI